MLHPAAYLLHRGLDQASAIPRGQMAGPGAMLAFETGTDPVALMRALRVVTPAVSLGSTDTLIEHPASLTHGIVGAQTKAATGISPGLLRLSVGLEDPDDLWVDLAAALAAPAGRRPD